MTQPGKNSRLHHAALCVAAALFWCACPQISRGQSPITQTTQKQTNLKSLDDIQDGIRKGSLFCAAAPLSEKVLERLDGTANEQSFTVPLIVDRANNVLYVQAKINNKSVRLVLDSGAGPHMTLDKKTAQGIELSGKVSDQLFGSQGNESVVRGLAKSLTLGDLTLRQAVTDVSASAPSDYCLIGMEVFEHYRVTLDFGAQTMTLTRGGVLNVPNGGTHLTIPFDDDGGSILVPVQISSQDGWALLDSGSDVNRLSFKTAKSASSQLPPSDFKAASSDRKIGYGNSARNVRYIEFKVPVPISLQFDHSDVNFNTTSQIGMSDIDNVLDAGFNAEGNLDAILGFPFFLQFQRVIIDYPTHTLVLQYPAIDTPLKVREIFPTKHDRAWPGYKWLQKGYGWIEVPDGSVPPTPTPTPAAAQGTVSVTTGTGGGTVITGTPGSQITLPEGAVGATIVQIGTDTVSVTLNGVTKVYPCPAGSSINVEADGSVQISPPTSPVTVKAPVSEVITTTDNAVVVNEAEVINKELTVNNALVVNAAMTVNGGLTVNGALTVNEPLRVNGALTVTKALTVNGALMVCGPIAAPKAVTVNGAMTISSGGTTVKMTNANGSAAVTINGVTKVYSMLSGSGLSVDSDGSVQISPPANTAN